MWGKALELQAAASLLQVPVYTLLPTRSGTYKWVTYVPQDELDPFSDFPVEPPPPRNLFSIDHLELLNVNACHYNCIVNQLGKSPLDRPPLEPTVAYHQELL